MPLTKQQDTSVPRLVSIHRYPVKGMNGQSLLDVTLRPGEGLPLDRVLGLLLASGEPLRQQSDGWISSSAFLRLAVSTELSRYRLVVAEDSLLLFAPNGETLRIGLDANGRPEPADLAAANERVRAWFPTQTQGPVRIMRPRVAVWDWPDATVSIINLDTVQELARASGIPVDPQRFRANLYVSGLGAWHELALPGRRIRLGDAELEITWPTIRCRATTVRPGSGERDLNVPAVLASHFGHLYCGVYAQVLTAGTISVGDSLIDLGPRKVNTVNRTSGSRRPAARFAAQLSDPGRPRYAELTRRIPESPTVDTFTFLDPAGKDFQPGTHLRIHLTDDQGSLWRCYTITGATPTELRISVKRVAEGRMSQSLHALPIGARVLLSGPYGQEPAASDSNRPLLLAAAGIGITPILPVLNSLLAASSQRPITVLNVIRTAAENPLWDKITDLVGQLPNATAHLYVTGPGERLPRGARAGRPAHADLRKLAAGGDMEAYLCGPGGFVDSTRRALVAAGVPADAITDERFFSPRPVDPRPQQPPAPGPFAVHFTSSGVHTTWTTDSGTLLDVAESAGLRPRASCRAGACGSCRQQIRGRVAYLSEPAIPVDPGQALLCCAVPVTELDIHA